MEKYICFSCKADLTVDVTRALGRAMDVPLAPETSKINPDTPEQAEPFFVDCSNCGRTNKLNLP